MIGGFDARFQMEAFVKPIRWAILLSALGAVCAIGMCRFGPGYRAQSWLSDAETSPPGVEWNERIEVTSGEAEIGPWKMNRSNFNYVDDPTVAVDEKGKVTVAWVDNNRKDIYLQKFDADGKPIFDRPTRVSKNHEVFSWLPKMATSKNGQKIYVLWQEIVFSGGTHGGEAFFAMSDNGGRTFSSSQNLSESKAGDGKGRLSRELWHNGSLDIAKSSDGSVYATWTEYEGRLLFSRMPPDRDEFTDPMHVGGSFDAPARGPTLATDGDGRICIVWTVGNADSENMRSISSSDSGVSFTDPKSILEADGHADSPKISMEPNGTIHLVYGEGPKGPPGPYQIKYSRKPPDQSTFRTPRTISRPQSDKLLSTHFPALARDGEGNLFVLWELYPDPGAHPRGLGFTYAGKADTSFAPPSVIPGTTAKKHGVNGSLQGHLMRKMDVNEKGKIGVVNSRIEQGSQSRIFLNIGQTDF